MQLESSKVIVIFDVDGTINQTEVYAVKAYRKALEEVGKTGFSDKEFIERIGAPFEQDVRYFFGENQSEQVEIFKTLIQKYWIDGMKESAKTFEGIHQMLEELKEKHDCITGHRGIALMQGLEFDADHPVGDIVKKALEKGLIIISAGNNVIRFVPPLVIEKEHVDEMISILEDCIA